MKDMSWIEMMKKAQEIRLFTSLQIKRAALHLRRNWIFSPVLYYRTQN